MTSNKQIQSLIQQLHSSTDIRFPPNASSYKVEGKSQISIESTREAMAGLSIDEVSAGQRQSSVV